MLLRTAQKYGVRVQSLQHVLEGYKVAAEIAAHGASASTFSDWWAYKIEAYDAIPHNAALLDRGRRERLHQERRRRADAPPEPRGRQDGQVRRRLREPGPGDDHDQPGPRARARRATGLDRGRQGRGYRALQRPSVRRLLAVRAGLDRRRGLSSSGTSRGEDSACRPGEHTAMPAAPESVRNRSIEIAAQPKNLFALVGANLHPVSGPEIKGGTLVIAAGKIAAIGPAGTPIPPEAQTIEMSGLDIWPGMVDAGSTIGLFEIGSLAETQDSADAAQFQPELRSSTALHPDSEHIPVTRANGILTSFVEPTGGTISGQGCLIDLNGWVPRELVIADQVALDVTIPTYIARTPESRRPGLGPERPGPRARGAPGERTRHASGARNGSTRSRSFSAKRSPTTPSSPRPATAATLPPRPTPGSRHWLPMPAARSR